MKDCGKHGRDVNEPFECHICEDDDHIDESAHRAKNKLLIVSVLCVIFMICEAVGGYFAKSLAIMTDAAHLLSDLAGFLISVFSIWITSRPASGEMSFGWHRAEIIGALVSVLLIWALTGVLLYEAVLRVKKPEHVDGRLMFLIATVGFIVNTVMAIVLHKSGHGHSHGAGGGHGHGGHGGGDSHGHSHGGHSHDRGSTHEDEHSHGGLDINIDNIDRPLIERPSEGGDENMNLNVRAAFIHILGDMIQSIGVMIAAAVIWWKPTYNIVDPICTFVFSVIVLFTTFKLVLESMKVLMEGTPDGIDHKAVNEALNSFKNINAVHDLHIWSIKVGRPALSVHILVDRDCDDNLMLRQIQDMLVKRFGICHSTIQIERSIQ